MRQIPQSPIQSSKLNTNNWRTLPSKYEIKSSKKFCRKQTRKKKKKKKTEKAKKKNAHPGVDELLDAAVGEAAEEARAVAVPRHGLERAHLGLPVEEHLHALAVHPHQHPPPRRLHLRLSSSRYFLARFAAWFGDLKPRERRKWGENEYLWERRERLVKEDMERPIVIERSRYRLSRTSLHLVFSLHIRRARGLSLCGLFFSVIFFPVVDFIPN